MTSIIRDKARDEINKITAETIQLREHELSCNYNPINKTCYTCKHYYCKDHGWQKCEVCNAGLFNNSLMATISELDFDVPHKQCEKYEHGEPIITKIRGV